MTREQQKEAVLAVLFAMGKAVERAKLAYALEITDEETEELLREIMTEQDERESGLRIIRLEDSYQLCTREMYYDTLIRVASQPVKPVLTDVMLEVLSVIAYRQPVTRSEIDRIRGVKSDYTVNRLVEYRLVEEAGRLDAPGRPILFRTTEEFLREFGLSSALELPMLSEEAMEEARLTVLKETGYEGQLSIGDYPLQGEQEKEEEE
ncbi:MAG: SMC-Scp complex subunit ScpB [Lachnospiraceae bacterium]|nr:SMC-Scp complex subunit ScpB [Lachnospiraceae bacterium]